ncbi:MAG TPA: outer membrane protein assembly factor BamA [bacterium]|nr:outer membrane protein assembly factor BamA [bacterium]
MRSWRHTLKNQLWALLALLAVSSPVLAQTTGDALPKIEKINLEGNHNTSSLVIYGHLREKEGDDFSLRKVRDDIHELYAMGDFKDVQANAEPGTHPNQVVLTFTLVERPLVGKITFKGNRKWGASKFMDTIKTAAKSPLDPSQLIADQEAIRGLYLDEGYASAAVSHEEHLNADTNTVDVEFNIVEGTSIKVGPIEVLGAEAFSAKKVADQMKDIHKGDKYKPEKLDEDLQQIEDFYHNEGYLRAAVVSHKERIDTALRTVFISITVKEGVQYTVGALKLEGNVLFDDSDMLKAFGLKTGDLLRQNDLDTGLRAMRSLYADKGYIYANVTQQMDYNDDLKKVDLDFKVTEGAIAYVQDVKIVGNYKTKDYVIRRELEVKPGDKFAADKIRESAQNLYNLGYFEEVNPEVQPGDTPGKEILVFRVKERQTGSISVGAGYSSVEQLVGNVSFKEENLFGKGQKFNVDLQFGALQTSIDAGFTEPWLFNTPTSLSVQFFDTTQTYNTNVIGSSTSTQYYDQFRVGGSLSLGRKLSRNWSIFGTYDYEYDTIYDVQPPFNDPTNPQYVPKSHGATSSFTPRVVFDSRDNYFDPHTGWKHQLSVEFAGGPLGANYNYIKVVEDTSHFIPLPLDFTLGEHVRFGVAQAYPFLNYYADLPIYDKFFAGGTDTIRGYNERTVGPLNGGNALFVNNLELKHALVGPLRGVLFLDGGNCWSDYISINNDLQWGAGLGLRLTIPGTVMAIRLDYGWPIITDLPISSAPRGGVLHFNLGDIF